MDLIGEGPGFASDVICVQELRVHEGEHWNAVLTSMHKTGYACFLAQSGTRKNRWQQDTPSNGGAAIVIRRALRPQRVASSSSIDGLQRVRGAGFGYFVRLSLS